MTNLHNLKPVVARHWLLLLAGFMWTAVGLMLLGRAIGWLGMAQQTLAPAISGATIAVGSCGLMFRRVAHKNISRIHGLPDRVSLFAFNSIRGYLIIVFMIALGITLRHSPLRRDILAILYTAMGGALLMASLHFYERFWAIKKQP